MEVIILSALDKTMLNREGDTDTFILTVEMENSLSSDLMNKQKYPSTEQCNILGFLRDSVRPVAALILTLYIVYY